MRTKTTGQPQIVLARFSAIEPIPPLAVGTEVGAAGWTLDCVSGRVERGWVGQGGMSYHFGGGDADVQEGHFRLFFSQSAHES